MAVFFIELPPHLLIISTLNNQKRSEILIILIDANNLAFRADQTSDLTTKSGKRVGAIYGTLRMIKSYITPTEGAYHNKIIDAAIDEQFIDPDFPYVYKVACAWDGGKSEFRKSLYPDYKGQRERKRLLETEEDKQKYKAFVEQMRVIDDNLPLFGVHSIKVHHFEADDIIYFLSQHVTKNDDQFVIIVSTDKDMLQLVNSHIAVWSPYKEVLYTKENFEKLVGLKKSSFIDYRVLVGDTSDNIKGIKGIGEKTAKQLIGQYKNIDNMLADRKHLIKKVRTAHIFEEQDKIKINRQLMDMQNIPLKKPFKEKVMDNFYNRLNFNGPAVKKLFYKYQFTSLLSDFLQWSIPFRGLE